MADWLRSEVKRHKQSFLIVALCFGVKNANRLLECSPRATKSAKVTQRNSTSVKNGCKNNPPHLLKRDYFSKTLPHPI